ncbi:MAG: hypothetical protein KBC64_07150 [Simkaniaceae bacterium]|nr:hypothetical protein [Simkaniaceae bacterium]
MDGSCFPAAHLAKYGSNQAAFLAESAEIVASATEDLRGGAGFYDIFEKLTRKRYEMAVAHGSSNAEHFGVKRYERISGWGVEPFMTMQTPLYGSVYGRYNQKFLERLASVLKEKMGCTPSGFATTSYEEIGTSLGRGFKYTVEVLSEERMSAARTLNLIDEINPHKLRELVKANGRLFQLDVLQLLKTQDPATYREWKIGCALQDKTWTELSIRPDEDEIKKVYLFVTVRLEINRQYYALSQYMVSTYADGVENPADYMQRCSITKILHQDALLVKTTLDDIAKIFHEALAWNKETKSFEDLKTQVQLLRYELGQCTPLNRGSAAVAEWLGEIIASYHGLEKSSLAISQGDLKALASLSLAQFIEECERT